MYFGTNLTLHFPKNNDKFCIYMYRTLYPTASPTKIYFFLNNEAHKFHHDNTVTEVKTRANYVDEYPNEP